MWIELLKSFIIGGILCVIGEILIQKTKLTPGKVLVLYVVSGALLAGLGLYQPLVEFAHAGATVPLTGFGYALVNGTIEALKKFGFIGIFIGGITATAGGVSAAIFFSYLCALIFDPKERE